MDVLNQVFASLCGQQRCFVVDGLPLPVCQRCLGLYLGALLTGLWLLVSGVWRRGLPPTGLVTLHALLLGSALLGGTHVIDVGPRWRLFCGLSTGHVVVLWLVCGATQLWHAPGEDAPRRLAWGLGQTRAAGALIALFAVLAAAWPTVAALGRSALTLAAALGAGVLGLALLRALAATARNLYVTLRGRLRCCRAGTRLS